MKNAVFLWRLLLVALPGLIVVAPVLAQKKVLGKPDQFRMPTDYFDNPLNYEKYIQVATKNKDAKNAWLVISDRDNNSVYEKPDLNSAKVGVVGFREHFYVLEEEKDWIKIVDAQVDELRITNKKRELGWIPKKNILLWNSGVVGLSSNIHKKVLLLNRADDIRNVLKLQDKLKVDIYRAPDASSTKEPDLKIFEFYFVMKRENNMVLLCQESEISPFTLEKIVGWVDERRCSPWNTRICLEPNYEPEGFEERKANPNFRLRAFETFEAASAFAETGGPEKNVYWKDDPVGIRREKMSKSNPNRFNGSVVRFPMLSSNPGATPGFDYFRSGIVGSIKVKKESSKSTSFDSEIAERDYSPIKEYVDEMDRKTDNVNIFFVIEGTDSTYAFKDHIIQAINAINSDVVKGIPNVNYGALIYRDLPEEKTPKGDRLTEFIRLTRDFDKVTAFIQKTEFRNYVDRDDYTALYHGMLQSLTQAGFRKDELNIILLIGNFGDFKIDADRKKAALKTKKNMVFDDLSTIYQNLNELDAHLYAIQLRNEGTKASNGFAKSGQILILESAKYAYNKYYGNKDNPQTKELLSRLSTDHKIAVGEPAMADIFEGNDIPLEGGRFPGRLVKPAENRYLLPNQLTAYMKNDVNESIQFMKTLKAIVSDIFVKGSDADGAEIEGEYKIDAGRFAPALADMLNEMLKDDQVAKMDLFNALDDKYKLFAEVYIPRMIQGAKYPAVSYVLFMPESDLVEYQRLIQRCLNQAGSSYDKKRENLFEIYKELIVNFSGETALRSKKPDDFTRSELLQLMQGLYGSGLQINVPLDVRIGDIRDERKVTNDQIDELLQSFKRVEKFLTDALRAAEEYDFCYRSETGNRYYWIPLTDAF